MNHISPFSGFVFLKLCHILLMLDSILMFCEIAFFVCRKITEITVEITHNDWCSFHFIMVKQISQCTKLPSVFLLISVHVQTQISCSNRLDLLTRRFSKVSHVFKVIPSWRRPIFIWQHKRMFKKSIMQSLQQSLELMHENFLLLSSWCQLINETTFWSSRENWQLKNNFFSTPFWKMNRSKQVKYVKNSYLIIGKVHKQIYPKIWLSTVKRGK